MKDLISIIYVIVLGGVCVCAFVKYNQTYKNLKSILLLLFATFIVDFIANVLPISVNYHFLYIIFGVIEYYLFGRYIVSIFNTKSIRIYFYSTFIIYLLISVFFLILSPNPKHFVLFNCRGLFIIISFIFYFKQLYESEKIIALENHPPFWIGIANLLFWSGTFFLMSLDELIYKISPETEQIISIINPIYNIFFYLIIFRAFLCKPS